MPPPRAASQTFSFDAAAAGGEPDVLVPQVDDALQRIAGLVEKAGDRQAARGAAVGQHRRRRHEPELRDVVVEPLGMRRVVGVVGGDPGEEVLVGLARHEVAVGQGRLAERGQVPIARALDVDPDPALVLELVADPRAAEPVERGLGWRCGRRLGPGPAVQAAIGEARAGQLAQRPGRLGQRMRGLGAGLRPGERGCLWDCRAVVHSRCEAVAAPLALEYRRTVHNRRPFRPQLWIGSFVCNILRAHRQRPRNVVETTLSCHQEQTQNMQIMRPAFRRQEGIGRPIRARAGRHPEGNWDRLLDCTP